MAGGRRRLKPWTQKYLDWVKREVHFEQPAQEATLLDYLHEVEHVAARIERLEQAIEEAVKSVPAEMRAVIEALQALRGIAQSLGGDHRGGTGRAIAIRKRDS